MSGNRPDRTLSLLAVCGIVGPILFTVVVIVLGLVRIGYSHVTQLMSELGEAGAPNAILFGAVGLVPFGVSIVAFAFGVHRGISGGKGSKIGPALIVVAGVCLVAGAIFPCDPGCVPVSFAGNMHRVVAVIGFSAMIFAPLAISQRMKDDELWHDYRSYSVATGILTAVFLILFLSGILEAWKGAIQRILLGTLLLWVEIMAIRLLRLSVR